MLLKKSTKKRKLSEKVKKPENQMEGTTEFPKYTPGQPFGIRRNREKHIQKIK